MPGSQEINAKIRNPLALIRIRTLAHAHYAVFLAADGADLRLREIPLEWHTSTSSLVLAMFSSRGKGAIKHHRT